MKDKAISFILGAIVGGVIVFGYSHYFGNTKPGFPGGQRPNFNHQRSGSGETINSGSGQIQQQATPSTTTTK